jgi:hypothetical protein
LATQEPTHSRIHQSLQPDQPRLFRALHYPDAAIDREKEIKGWRRSKKIKLIESMNPHWEDLAKDWGNEYKPEPAAADEREFPRPAGENSGLRADAPVTEPEAD